MKRGIIINRIISYMQRTSVSLGISLAFVADRTQKIIAHPLSGEAESSGLARVFYGVVRRVAWNTITTAR